jgi:hypothetical protein
VSELKAPAASGCAPRQPGTERRAAVRYPCTLASSCHTLTSRREDAWTATVKDISLTGIGLLLGRRFEPGILLAVELPAEGAPQLLLVRVVHTRSQGEGIWLIGCELVNPLTEDELQAVL